MELYWLISFTKLHIAFLIIGCFLSSIFGFFAIISKCISFSDDTHLDVQNRNDVYNFSWKMFLFGMFLCIFCCFFPTKQEVAIMMGWDAIKSDSVQEVVELLKDKLR